MLRLVKCEFMKLKRRKILLIFSVISCIFPLLLVYLVKAGTTASMDVHYLKSRFDYAYTMMLGYGLVFLMPCLIGIFATLLFFMERDNDTFKNIRCVPISTKQLIFAKLTVIFIVVILFSISSTLILVLASVLTKTGIVYGLPVKFLFSIIFGVFITLASLPIIVFIIYFNQSYLISVLMSFFYSILNWTVLGMVGTTIGTAGIKFLNSFPVICTMNWLSGAMTKFVIKDNLLPEAMLIVPGTGYTILLLGGVTIFSIFLIVKFYNKWSR